MSDAVTVADQYAEDYALTLANRARLSANQNLLYWYGELYQEQFKEFPDPRDLKILEIGSGVSPLKRFLPNVLTSDVLAFDYLDYAFDCHSIDQFEAITNQSLDVITLTNVLHHLRNPIDFLNKSASKLKPGGKVIATEPFFSVISTLIFSHLHHESVDFAINEPVLEDVRGPLASANIALPWLIFAKRSDWSERLREKFDFDVANFAPFSGISYMATGGISRRFPIPETLYRMLFRVDQRLSRRFPKLLPSFFTISLTRK